MACSDRRDALDAVGRGEAVVLVVGADDPPVVVPAGPGRMAVFVSDAARSEAEAPVIPGEALEMERELFAEAPLKRR